VVLFFGLQSASPENGNICCFSQRLLGISECNGANTVSTETRLSQKPAVGGAFCVVRRIFSEIETGWLGREDSNLRMVESKSGGKPSKINAHSEKRPIFGSNNINTLGEESE
jgi:hypothetical protein